MIRSKLGLLALCAMVLGVMAISASAAQAAGSWLVGTTEIVKSGEGVNLLAELTGEKDSETISLLTHLVGLAVTVSCTNFTTTGIHLGAEGKLSEGGKVTFTGCTTAQGGNCLVNSPGKAAGTVESEEGKGEAVLHTGGVVLTRLEPKTAANGFAKLRFTSGGKGCSLPESNTVNGSLFVKDCEGFAETLKVKHLIEQGPLTSLTVGADTVEHLETSIDGSAWVKLVSPHAGQEWRAMGV